MWGLHGISYESDHTRALFTLLTSGELAFLGSINADSRAIVWAARQLLIYHRSLKLALPLKGFESCHIENFGRSEISTKAKNVRSTRYFPVFSGSGNHPGPQNNSDTRGTRAYDGSLSITLAVP